MLRIYSKSFQVFGGPIQLQRGIKKGAVFTWLLSSEAPKMVYTFRSIGEYSIPKRCNVYSFCYEVYRAVYLGPKACSWPRRKTPKPGAAKPGQCNSKPYRPYKPSKPSKPYKPYKPYKP